MKRRGLIASLFAIIGLAVVALGATIAAGRSPLLGLDLRGGLSVVLQPQGKVTATTLQQAVDIIDRRVNGLGVANSTVQRQGNDVVVELPGIKDPEKALKVVGTTARLFFRPVICEIGPPAPSAAKPKSGTSTGSKPPTSTGGTTKSGVGATGRAASLTSALRAAAAPTPTHKDLTASLASACTSATASSVPSSSQYDANYQYDTVILPSSANSGYGSARWVLGPADLTGSAIKTASAEVPANTTNQYVVSMTLTGSGLNAFNAIAVVRHASYSPAATNQSYKSLEAFELDGSVESAPTIQSAPFTGPVQITGSFTSAQASSLALELRYGGLPVAFKQGNVNTVSALLGRASLRAGLYAGLGGIVLVLLYMIAYYRGLGLVVVLGLAVGGALLYAILTQLSYTSSLALTLPGITGIIVSIGITVDSYVVYFERLKDEVRKGQTIRSSVERGFTRAFKTVLTADLVSFLAALILYLFTVGDVRGFAFTLGLSTLLDVATAYFFIRPMVVLLGRRRTTSETSFLGIARGLGAAPAGGH